ncbi:Transcription factor [Penicillium solitum]|uniref:Transcription factor n=1 Tax=Penicillium solitum TaxID=60172 RepID=UPI0017F69A8C|nr:hypothetical protein HAV15_010019 [Penicillium sp. str. \
MVRLYPLAGLSPGFASESQGKIRDFGYSSHGNHNSMSLLRTVELYGGQDTSPVSSSAINRPPFPSDVDRKYRELVRQLPSKSKRVCYTPRF